jgi:hypothetical protein
MEQHNKILNEFFVVSSGQTKNNKRRDEGMKDQQNCKAGLRDMH